MLDRGPTDLEAIADRLTLLHEALGFSQAAFARLVGITPQALSNWVRAEARPNIDMAYKITRATGATPGWIYDGDTRGMPIDLIERLNRRERERRAATG